MGTLLFFGRELGTGYGVVLAIAGPESHDRPRKSMELRGNHRPRPQGPSETYLHGVYVRKVDDHHVLHSASMTICYENIYIYICRLVT